MNDRPAAFYAAYVDAKFMRGLKVMRLSIDIPIEQSNEFLLTFGAPNGTDPVPVAIARLNIGPGSTQGSAETSPPSAAEGQDKPRTYTRSQRAAMKCQDEAFGIWIGEMYPEIFNRYYIDKHNFTPEAADLTLKEALGISSKRDLDTDAAKAALYDKLETSFIYRDRVK